MQTPQALLPVLKIARYTLADDIRQKSFVVMFLVCVLFVYLSRGCYQGNYLVNGQLLNAGTVAGAVSKMVFHGIAAGTLVIAGLLAMRVFRRDRDNGMQACILSKPIARWQYVFGKTFGLWILAMLFMFILHGMVFLIMSIHLKVLMPEYLAGSLLCSFNLLFVILVVLLFSLMMPDIVAFLCVLGIGITSFVADGIYAITHNLTIQVIMQQPVAQPQADLTWTNVVYYVWPKLSGTERMASALIGHDGFHGFGSVYPILNILFYCLILAAGLAWRFTHEDVM